MDFELGSSDSGSRVPVQTHKRSTFTQHVLSARFSDMFATNFHGRSRGRRPRGSKRHLELDKSHEPECRHVTPTRNDNHTPRANPLRRRRSGVIPFSSLFSLFSSLLSPLFSLLSPLLSLLSPLLSSLLSPLSPPLSSLLSPLSSLLSPLFSLLSSIS